MVGWGMGGGEWVKGCVGSGRVDILTTYII